MWMTEASLSLRLIHICKIFFAPNPSTLIWFYNNLLENQSDQPRNYTFECQLSIWSRDDLGDTYEPYGELSVNIGSTTKSLWSSPENLLKITNNQVHTIILPSFTFQESAEFSSTGTIILIGNVFDWNRQGDHLLLGNYNGSHISVSDILNKRFTKRYPGEEGINEAYAELVMEIVPSED